jgi:hypothetical protein
VSAKATPSPAAGRLLRSRRSFLVDRRLQLRYTGLLVAAATAVAAVLGAVILYERSAYAALALACGQPAERGVLAAAGWLAAFVVTVAGLLGVVGVVLTHRVAGPLLYVEGVLRDVAAGRRPRLRPLRQGDELAPFYANVRASLVDLEARERDELAQLQLIVQALAAGDADIARAALTTLAAEKRGRIGEDG